MRKTASVKIKIEPNLKKRAERVFQRLGLSPTQAITMFYRQVELYKGLPFGVVIPNQTTLETFEGIDAGRGLIVCKDAADMFKKLGI